MKLTVERKALLDGLQVAARIAATSSSVAVYKSVLIEAEPGSIRLSAMDDRVNVNLTLPAEVSEAGAVAVPAKGLLDRVATLPDDAVTLATALDAQQLEVTCRKSKFEIYGLDPALFPNAPEVGGEVSFSLPQSTLKEMIRQTVFAADDEPSRPNLMGVCLILDGNLLRLVATDTHRMALRDAAIEGAGEAQCIVPTKAMAEILKLLSDGAAMVGVRVDTNQIAFRTDTATLACRLIDGKYPRYERVIPTSWDRRITLDRDTFIQALKRMLVEKVVTEKKSFTRVVCRTELGSLMLRTQGETGRAEDELECELEGEGVEFSVNCEHLMDALDTLRGASARLEMTEANKPILICGADEANVCKLIVMPCGVL